MRRTLCYGLLGASILLLTGVAPVVAGDREQISITAITTFDESPDTFTADGIPGCGEGIVENGPANFALTRDHGVFAGFKVFWCADPQTGFVLRLNALFGPNGSTGTWSVVDAWGDAAGMHGAGKLTGDPIEGGGITDRYWGTITR